MNNTSTTNTTITEILEALQNTTLKAGRSIIPIENAKAKIITWHQKEVDRLVDTALDEYMQDLKDFARDYHKKYPDADINDITGYIVGVRNQPQRKRYDALKRGGTDE